MSLDFDTQFLDTDFRKWPQFVFGMHPERPASLNLFKRYSAATPVMSREQVHAAIEKIDADGGGAERLVTRIFNQTQEGSCVGNATTQLLECGQALQVGKANVIPMSAISLYQLIAGGPMTGAQVSDALHALCTKGVMPLDTPKNRELFGDQVMPHTGYYTKRPAGWEKTAALFKGHEFLVIRSMDEMLTALCRQQPVVVGREGHSILYLRAFFKNGRLYFLYVNSWGKWGIAASDLPYGFGVDSESQGLKSAQWAFTVRSFVFPSRRAA
jgi:hypothetical protein